MLSQPKSKLWMVFTLLIVTNMIFTACGSVASDASGCQYGDARSPDLYPHTPGERNRRSNHSARGGQYDCAERRGQRLGRSTPC